jgi:hypothetical protein
MLIVNQTIPWVFCDRERRREEDAVVGKWPWDLRVELLYDLPAGEERLHL